MGEGVFASDQPLRAGSAISITHSFVLSIEKDAMLSVVHREPCIFGPICRGTCLVVTTRLSETCLTNLSALLRSLGPRLCCRPASEPKRDSENVVPKISQDTLGGNGRYDPRNRPKFSMNRFRQLGPIDYGSGLEVHSSLLDIVLHE
jgi:CRP/FNR family transcriptional regulator, cyclic AMP receptor protein